MGNPDTVLNGTANDDRALPFEVEGLDVRGRVVTLGGAIDTILSRHDFPDPVRRLVGEATVLAALLATSLKDTGRFILQSQTDGPVSMIVVDIRTPGQIRATASFDAEAVAELEEAGGNPSSADLLGRGSLAMTVEQGHSSQRYQGFVPIDGNTLEEAAHIYFRQSEQIPTRIRLAVAEIFDRDDQGEQRQAWRAGGIIAQFLPESEDRIRHRDLPGGDNPNPDDLPGGGETAEELPDDDAWVEASVLLDTVEDHELTDPEIPAERLLVRLFHERGARVFEPQDLHDHCTCSRERIHTVLDQMSSKEIGEASVSGTISVKCEFCGLTYDFDPKGFLAES
jgi:molecular chaperone Hsp33